MGGDAEDEHLDRLLDHAYAAEPPAPGDVLAHLLHAAATADPARASAGEDALEDAAVAAFRAAQGAARRGPTPGGSVPDRRPQRRLILAGVAAAALAALLITATALLPRPTDTGHTQAPTHSRQPTSPSATTLPQSTPTGPLPLDNTTTINLLAPTAAPTTSPTAAEPATPTGPCHAPSAAHAKTPPGWAIARKTRCSTG